MWKIEREEKEGEVYKSYDSLFALARITGRLKEGNQLFPDVPIPNRDEEVSNSFFIGKCKDMIFRSNSTPKASS